ncbi:MULTISPECIES: tetratricopeptide repeat protein [Clostridium]|uniref:tetratricopeptide repeat protein n=1 Tax=Clostridium TaxID=1485 RepID=UPI000824C7FB|nr:MULTISPECIES: tetratricopeptide repeat protein [Clostridium]PJI07265.1 hypothetical protein CUB90_05035 [Clostridium sp. CT7]
MIRGGLRIRYESHMDLQLKDIIIEFARWLRKKYIFPIRLTIYIRYEYKSKANNSDKFLASFLEPDSEKYNPHIRVEVKNHRDDVDDTNEFRKYILISIAHEIIHYMQWIKKVDFCEKEAEYKSEKLVQLFIKERFYDLTITHKVKKLLELADKRCEKGKFDEAISIYNQVMKIGCYDNGGIYNSVAYCYDCIGDYTEALKYYDMALKLNSKDSTIYINKGFALQSLERHREAIENFDKSIEIMPSKEAYVFKADSEGRLKQFMEAINCCDEALNLDLNYDIAYNMKGQFLYVTKRFNEAKRIFLKAISINSNYADAYYNLALTYAKLDDFKASMDYLKVAIKIDRQYIVYAKEEDILKDYNLKL